MLACSICGFSTDFLCIFSLNDGDTKGTKFLFKRIVSNLYMNYYMCVKQREDNLKALRTCMIMIYITLIHYTIQNTSRLSRISLYSWISLVLLAVSYDKCNMQVQAGNIVATLFGKWDESMHYVNGDCSSRKSQEALSEAQLLWRRSKPPKYPTRYNLTRFAMTLNELIPGLKVILDLYVLWFHVSSVPFMYCRSFLCI